MFNLALLATQVRGTYEKCGFHLELPSTAEVETRAMSERKESSVLFSLRELQTIEEERVSEEAQAAQNAIEAARAAKEAEERRIREEEEARRNAAEAAERQAREEVERRQREEQMRLEESERRARVEAQAQIEQQRLAKEMELRAMEAERKKPAWIIAALGVLILVGGLALFFKNQADDREKARKEKIATELALKELKSKMTAAQVDIDNAQADMDKAFKQLEDAKDEESRLAAIAARKQAKADLKASRAKLQRLKEQNIAKAKRRKKAKARREKATIDKCAKSNDPLCGL